MGDWIDDNKGEGPWDFEKQKNKWGYLNNPRWMETPGEAVNYDGREDEEPQVWDTDLSKNASRYTQHHIPCGHWHVPVIVPTTEGPL